MNLDQPKVSLRRFAATGQTVGVKYTQCFYVRPRIEPKDQRFITFALTGVAALHPTAQPGVRLLLVECVASFLALGDSLQALIVSVCDTSEQSRNETDGGNGSDTIVRSHLFYPRLV